MTLNEMMLFKDLLYIHFYYFHFFLLILKYINIKTFCGSLKEFWAFGTVPPPINKSALSLKPLILFSVHYPCHIHLSLLTQL